MSKQDYEVVWLVRRLFRALAEKSAKDLRALGLSAADRAVMEFLYPDEHLSVPAIAERYQVSRQHVQTTVNPLLEKRLLKSSPNPHHKRSPLISLTTSGRKLFDRIMGADLRAVDALFEGISERDRTATARTLRSLLGTLKENGN